MWSLESHKPKFKSWLCLPKHFERAGYMSITSPGPSFLIGKRMAGMCLLLRTKQDGCVLYHANFNYSHKLLIKKIMIVIIYVKLSTYRVLH